MQDGYLPAFCQHSRSEPLFIRNGAGSSPALGTKKSFKINGIFSKAGENLPSFRLFSARFAIFFASIFRREQFHGTAPRQRV